MIIFMILTCLLLLITVYQSAASEKKTPDYPPRFYKQDVENPYFNPYLPYETLNTAQKEAQEKQKEAQVKRDQLLLRILYTLLFVFCIIAFLTYY
jgi:hypothetical protein